MYGLHNAGITLYVGRHDVISTGILVFILFMIPFSAVTCKIRLFHVLINYYWFNIIQYIFYKKNIDHYLFPIFLYL